MKNIVALTLFTFFTLSIQAKVREFMVDSTQYFIDVSVGFELPFVDGTAITIDLNEDTASLSSVSVDGHDIFSECQPEMIEHGQEDLENVLGVAADDLNLFIDKDIYFCHQIIGSDEIDFIGYMFILGAEKSYIAYLPAAPMASTIVGLSEL